MSQVPATAEANAIIRPSGDQAGLVCSPSPRVRRVSFRAAGETAGTDAGRRTGQNAAAASPMTTATAIPPPSHDQRRAGAGGAASRFVDLVTAPSTVAMNL